MSFLTVYGDGKKMDGESRPRFLHRAAEAAVADLKKEGKFCRTSGGLLFYVTKNSVTPLTDEDLRLRSLIDEKFHINPASREIYGHLLAAFQMAAHNNGELIEIYSFAHADPNTKTIYISLLDGKRMLKLTGNLEDDYENLPIEENGCDGIYFLDDSSWEPWQPTMVFRFDEEIGEEIVESPEGYVRRYLVEPVNFTATENLTVEDQRWLFEKYIHTLFLDLSQKPIVLFTGVAGSAKTTALRHVAKVLFGPSGQESTVDKEDAFKASVAASPFLIVDNLDNRQPEWLPTALCTASTGAQMAFRQLYTTNQLVRFRPRAAIALTSTDTRFTDSNAALSDRTFVFRLERISGTGFRSPEDLEPVVLKHRNLILTEIAFELNRYVYAWRNYPAKTTKLRIASFGIALANLASVREAKRVEEIIAKLQREQQALQREGNVMVMALDEYFAMHPDRDNYEATAGQLAEMARAAVGSKLSAPGMGRRIHADWSLLQQRYRATHDSGKRAAMKYTFHRPTDNSEPAPVPASELQPAGAK